jgi:hypothetical protein
MVLAFACATAVAARIGLIAYIDATSILGAVNPLYLSPASPPLLVFVVLGLYLGGGAARAAFAANRAPTSAPKPPDAKP